MALRKKTGATEAREKLFDRVFKPQEMLLPNGHSVMRPRSRLPLIWGVILIAIAWALWFTGFDVSILIARLSVRRDLKARVHAGHELPGQGVEPPV